MRFFVFLVLGTMAALGTALPAGSFEVINVPEDVNAVNLTAAIDLVEGTDGRVQLSTAAGEDGIIRRIEVIAANPGTNPKWALFALKNESDTQIERLLVAPFFRLPGSGFWAPDLGHNRISVLTPSFGLRPERLTDGESDVFEVTLDPGATITFVAELANGHLPELIMWQPDAYRDYVSSFTLFRGTVLGISSLAAVFLTILFVVKGRGVFPATAAFAWAVLLYLLIDFGLLGRVLGVGNASIQPLRAAAEAGVATTLFGFLFIYLNLHRWHMRFIHLGLALAFVFLALFGLAFLQPSFAATIARTMLVLLGVMGFFLILLLALRGYDRAVLLTPTWIILIAWLFYGWLVITGQVSNDIAQPAVGGGLVLLVMLIAFTAVQHAFSEGQVSVGTLSEVERRALALTGSGDFVFDWNVDRDRVTISEEMAARLGERRSGLRTSIKAWLDRIHPEDHDRFRTALDTLIEMRRGKVNADVRITARGGAFRNFRLRAKPVLGGDGQVGRIVGTFQDVTDERIARSRLLHDAVYDSLTGLPNKALFLDRLERALVRCRTGAGAKPAVFLIDIDKFTDIDERIGSTAADSVLLAVSRRIARLLHPLDTMARLKADQFAVIVTSEKSAGKIAEIAEQVRKALRAPVSFGERDLTLTASIGITIYDNKPAAAADVLGDAELAMYYAKRHGGDRIEAYRASARAITAYTKANEEDIERGLEAGEFQVQFQPIVDLNTGRITAAEALMRWDHVKRGNIPPDEFIPLAERTGMIDKIGRLAFEQAARQIREWTAIHQLDESFFISINLSTRQLANQALLNDLRHLIGNHRQIAGHLKFEVTESQVMSNPEHSAYVLAALKELGIGLALDDFGTGHSSLSYLHRFPFDTIKVAASFIQMNSDSGIANTQVPIIRAIVGLAAELDLAVIAEGVETEAEADRLRQLSCRYAQGFAFGAAMSATELEQRLGIKRVRQSQMTK